MKNLSILRSTSHASIGKSLPESVVTFIEKNTNVSADEWKKLHDHHIRIHGHTHAMHFITKRNSAYTSIAWAVENKIQGEN